MYPRVFRMISFFILVAVLASAFAEPASSGNFSILFVQPQSDSTYFQALIAGGYVDGIDEGMDGSVLSTDSTGNTVQVAAVAVVEADKYESSCLVRRLGDAPLSRNQKITLKIPELSAEAALVKGHQSLQARKFERAHFYFSKALQNATSEDSSVIQPFLDSAVVASEAHEKRRLTREERSLEADKVPIYLSLAQYYFSADKLDRAEDYFGKVRKIQRTNTLAKEMLEIISELKEGDALFDSTLVADMTDEGEKMRNPLEEFPAMKTRVKPWYPREAIIAGTSGTTRVRALIGKTGAVLKAMVEKSSGSELLDNAAVVSAYRTLFKPGRRKGERVRCWVMYDVTFETDKR